MITENITTTEKEPPQNEAEVCPELETAVRFLCALFDPEDTILFRPIESWTDARTRSRVDFKNTRYNTALPDRFRITLLMLLRLAETTNVNLFYGVCPRLGREGDVGKFDLAWQIRTARTLWVDIDNITVDEAREKIAKAELPQPSILVNSGNGVHVYWLLEQPYLIDDVGQPPPVEHEWPESTGGRKKPPRKYILDDGEKVYLDQRPDISRLSPQALYIQDVLAGIAQSVDGDSTHDLARLLRVPGSMNRKDQCNGREPVPTELIECDPSRRYALAEFERFKIVSSESDRVQKIAAMTLPKPRKPSASKSDKLADHINRSLVAPVGSRSETDFALCCFAIKNGIDAEHVWGQVENVGKFAESGRRYFDRTWEAAEQKCREDQFEKTTRQLNATPGSNGKPIAGGNNHSADTIVVLPDTAVAKTFSEITSCLLEEKIAYTRADQVVVVRGDKITPILSPAPLAGLLSEVVEFMFCTEKASAIKPFPAEYGNAWLHNHRERARLPEIKLFTRNPVFSKDWRLITPGYDQKSGIYYAGPVMQPREGTHHLDTLLRDFCFVSAADRTNYLGMLITAILIPHFIGSKPMALFNGNQPELGKSILAQIISILRDAIAATTATYNSNDEEFEKRLGAVVRSGATTIIVDNAKGQSRSPRIESAVLERSITDPILSYRLLGHSALIQAENSHIFCLTANSSSVSRDLVTRSAVINLFHEGDPKRRTFSMDDPEAYAMEHRSELLGELLGMIQRWIDVGKPLAHNAQSRFNKAGWGKIVGGILHESGEPDFLDNADEAAEKLDDTRVDFAAMIAIMADHPQGVWTANELQMLARNHNLLGEQLGDGSARSRATKMGVTAGRFVGEKFLVDDDRTAIFAREESRKHVIYRVGITD